MDEFNNRHLPDKVLSVASRFKKYRVVVIVMNTKRKYAKWFFQHLVASYVAIDIIPSLWRPAANILTFSQLSPWYSCATDQSS